MSAYSITRLYILIDMRTNVSMPSLDIVYDKTRYSIFIYYKIAIRNNVTRFH